MKRKAMVFLPPSGDSLPRDLQNALYLELGLWSALAMPPCLTLATKKSEDLEALALPLTTGEWIQDEEGWGLKTRDGLGSSGVLRLATRAEPHNPLPHGAWEKFVLAHPVPPRRWNWGYWAVLEWELLPNGDHWDSAQWSLSQRKVYRSKPVLM